MIAIPLSSKKYPGLFALIDDDDFERVSKYSWCPIIPKKGYTTYAQANIDGKYTYLHRFIMNAQKGEEVDHKDGDQPNYGLDCRKSNLRKISHGENIRNSKKSAGKTSVFKGVSYFRWGSHTNRWIAQIRLPGAKKSTFLGYFPTEADAALAYNDAAIKAGLTTARLNKVEVWNPNEHIVIAALLDASDPAYPRVVPA